MKRVYLIIVLVLGGYLIYHFTLGEESVSTDTPIGTAKAFVQAAYKEDATAIRGLCVPGAADRAIQVASQIRQGSPSVQRFKWRNIPPSAIGRSAVTTVFLGRVFTIELVEQEGPFKIVALELAQ